jgi:orotidine-5'-phosphate decarboxylase
MHRNFFDLLAAQWAQKKFLSVALDPDIEKLPEIVRQSGLGDSILSFNKHLVEVTKDIVCAYKLNAAFYEAHGEEGQKALETTIEFIREVAPQLPIIMDAKRADIGNTNQGYVRAIFDRLRADAVTVHPYLGAEALEPFLAQRDKGIFVLCRTSNAGAAEFQDLQADGKPLYLHVAQHVNDSWNGNKNCGLVVGATYPEEMKAIRAVSDDIPFLVPGVGAQGGDIEQTMRCGKNSRGEGLIITVARAIIYASAGKDFAKAAHEKALVIDGDIRRAL